MPKAAKPIVPSLNPDGTAMDLVNPQVRDIDFADMANGLSEIARFNAICPGTAYSVAQHSVVGADALDHETGDKILAGYFLLHDGHEYRFGDWTRPSVEAVVWQAMQFAGKDDATAGLKHFIGEAIRRAVEAQKRALDLVIWQAANLPEIGLMPIYAHQVKDMDDRMCRAEGLALFGPKAASQLPAANRPPPRIVGNLAKPWPAAKAREAFIDRLERYLGIVVRG